MVDRIQLHKVKLHYSGNVVFENLNYAFHDKIYVIRGERKSGKSSLLKMIAGYEGCSSGEIEIVPGSEVSYLFQDETIFDDLTVKENLYIMSNAIHSQVDNFELNAKNAVKRFDISNLINYKVSLLSSAEKRKMQLAALLLVDPDVILIDEPITRPEEKSQWNVLKENEKMWGDRLIIIVSRYKVDIKQDHVELELKRGKLTEVPSFVKGDMVFAEGK